MATNIPEHELHPSPDTQLREITEILVANPGPAADAAWRLLDATKAMLACPVLTRDMVSRGEVSRWLRRTAAEKLATGGGAR